MEQSWTFVRGVANTALDGSDGLEAGGSPSAACRGGRGGLQPTRQAGSGEWGQTGFWGRRRTPPGGSKAWRLSCPRSCSTLPFQKRSDEILLNPLPPPRAPREAPPLGSSALSAPWCLPPGLLPCPLPRSRCRFFRAEMPSPQPVGSAAPPGVPVMVPWHTAPSWWLCLAVLLVRSMALALGLVPGVRRALGTGLRKEAVCGQGGSLTKVSRTPGAGSLGR